MSPLLQTLARLVLGVGLLAVVPRAVEQRLAQPLDTNPSAAADAKPIFLTARAAAAGGDPTDPELVEALARDHQLYRGGHRIQGPLPTGKGSPYASLYPPMLPAVVARLGPERWWDFVGWWRRTGLGLLLAGGAAAGAAGARSGIGRLAGALGGLAAALWCTPGLDAALQLGQANLHLAGLSGAALLGLSLGGGLLTGLVLAAGTTLKLAPLALGPVLLLGRRWWGLLGLGLGLAGTLALASENTDLMGILEDIRASLAYAGRLNPEWLEHHLRPPPRWVWKLWAVRGLHLGLATAGLALAALAGRPRGERLAVHGTAAGALVFAWLALVAAPGQIIYGPLLLPALAWLVGGALDLRGGPVGVLAAVVALGSAGLMVAGRVPVRLAGLDPAAPLTVLAGIVWTCTAAALLARLRPALRRPWRSRLPLLATVAAVVALAWLAA